MTRARVWTMPADVTDQLRRIWDSGRLLSARLSGEALFPLALRLVHPGNTEIAERFQEVRDWIRTLDEGSKAARGFGYEIAWTEVNARLTGRNRLPSGLTIPTEEDALRLLGLRRDADRFTALATETQHRFPVLRDWLIRKPLRVLEYAEDWARVLAVLERFQAQSSAGLYLRQLDIPGVDTKFIESCRGLLTELLDLVLPVGSVKLDAVGVKSFEARYGLRSKPPLIRFRLLDERLFVSGLSDISTPATQFAALNPPVVRVFITENEINGLAFPMMNESLVIFGLGYDVERLDEVDWLRNTSIYYWGDLDTHGFSILSRLRKRLPGARSFLMDRETLLAHRAFWVRDTLNEGALDSLTREEQSLYQELQSNALGDRVRLEQERVSFGWLGKALRGLS